MGAIPVDRSLVPVACVGGRQAREAADIQGMNVLPDVLRPGLRLVICGSAAGVVSAARGEYYAGPGNKFWDILAVTGLTPRRLLPHEFRDVLDFGIGLTD